MKAMKTMKAMKKAMNEEQHCQGQASQVFRLQGNQGQDLWWPDQGQAHQEQSWQSCLQGNVCSIQEKVCQGHRPLEQGCAERPQRAWHQGLPGCWWKVCTGQGFVCQGQVSVQCLNGATVVAAAEL